MGNAHVIFGAGQVGVPLAERLASLGYQVTLISRSGLTRVPGVTTLKGDALDATACNDAARGAAVVYNCMNPAYSAAVWAEHLPRVQGNLIAAAGRANARLVVLDNIYALGRPNGRELNEQTPVNPCSRKGEVRARVAEALFDAHRRGDAQAVSGRASDFYGPRGIQTMFERRFWTRALAGRSVPVIVNPDTRHTYHYIPDVAAGLATLGQASGDDVCGRWWILPAAPAVTTRELVAKFAHSLGTALRLAPVPLWFQLVLGLALPLFRELSEMRYQWEEAFVVDDRLFRARFGTLPTPLDDGANETVRWARATFDESV